MAAKRRKRHKKIDLRCLDQPREQRPSFRRQASDGAQKSEKPFLDLGTSRVRVALGVADDLEPALLQDSNGGDVVLGGTGVDGSGSMHQELGHGTGGESLAPEFPAQPVGHFRFRPVFVAHDMTGNLAAELNCPNDDRRRGNHFLPVGHECRPVGGIFGREGRHVGRLLVQLLFEEDWEVVCGDVAEESFHRVLGDCDS